MGANKKIAITKEPYTIQEQYTHIRQTTIDLCTPLHIEDYGAQPITETSPPKWHLAHTTWFFETFVLIPHVKNYKPFHPTYHHLFNSYYESHGARIARDKRGHLTRPLVQDIYTYRSYVDHAMNIFLEGTHDLEILKLVEIGLHHEQQHQELLLADIKFILGTNPLFPAYAPYDLKESPAGPINKWIKIPQGTYTIGADGSSFCFDNEQGSHQVLLPAFEISNDLVTNEEYLEFIQDGGYESFELWHEEGWAWVQEYQHKAPLYWHKIDGEWFVYTLKGLYPLTLNTPVLHLSFYEASAFAAWKKMRLPTEFEWEAAQNIFSWGYGWEWTSSAYLPYPGFCKEQGALGEYNGKFMVNQIVLRGASFATPLSHRRSTYRNFFHPHITHQFSTLRLAK